MPTVPLPLLLGILLPQILSSRVPTWVESPPAQPVQRRYRFLWKTPWLVVCGKTLGGCFPADAVSGAQGERWQALSALLPNLTTATSFGVRQIDLKATIGIKSPFPAFHPSSVRLESSTPALTLINPFSTGSRLSARGLPPRK